MSLRLQTLACALSIVAGLSITPPAGAEAPFSEIIVFGDSISDTGNAFLGFLGGGVAAAPPYVGGNFSNGPVWVEVLADELGLPRPAPSLVGGTNYAWGGAETAYEFSFFGTPSVGIQIESFLTDRGFTGDELIVVAAGSNDLIWQPPFSPGLVVRNLSEHISVLAGAGGTTFLVPNIVPQLASLVKPVNLLMDLRFPELEKMLGITILQFDMGGVYEHIRQFPQDFGLTNLTDPACPGCGVGLPAPGAADTVVPDPDEYFFWDQLHWTRVTHQAIGEAAAEAVSLAVPLD
jgi:phospholipase/lecithinase/hemolysin